MEATIELSLQSFSKASDMWSHLCKLYRLTNTAQSFYLDTELAESCQGDKTAQEYCNGFLTLLNEKDSMFLKFKSVWATLMNGEVTPAFNTCL